MTPQEQQMIDGLVDRIRNTSVADKDFDADRYLKQALASSPDAIYLLAQTVLVQQYGLQQAQSQIASLQDQLRSQPTQPSGGGSFLSHLFGGSGSQSATPPQTQTPPYQPVNNPGNPPNATPGWAAYGGQSATPPAYAQPMMYPPPPTGYAPAGGGFLRNALQTAAGVAAGEVAFAGMESLFHGFGGSGGYSGGGFGGGGYEGGRPEEIVNNYYDDGDRGEHRETRGDSDYSRDDSNMGIDPNAPDEGFDNNDTSSGDTGFDSSSDDSNSY